MQILESVGLGPFARIVLISLALAGIPSLAQSGAGDAHPAHA